MAINETYLGNPVATAKELYTRDVNNYISKNLLNHPADSYDSAQKQMAPMNPLWWMSPLVVSKTAMILPDFVKFFYIYDEKFFLRAGAVHTETGIVYPELVTREKVPKPGEPLVTPKARYIKIIQEESGKDSLHLRTHVDWRKFDHAERFFSYGDYRQIIKQNIDVMAKANNMYLRTAFAAMIIGMTGGCVMFDEVSDLHIFFQGTGSNMVPSEEWSKQAKEYFENDGEIKKSLKANAGLAALKMKNKGVFDPSIIVDEIHPVGTPIEDSKFPDLSDKSKTIKWLRSMYLGEKKNNKDQTHDLTRRKSLWALLSSIDYKISRMTYTTTVSNWMGFDTTRTQVTENTLDYAMRARKEDLVVLMNLDDLNQGRSTVGGVEIGVFAPASNGTINRLEQEGVRFFGIPYMLPGTFLILHKNSYTLVQFLEQINEEEFDFHIIQAWIRHSMYKIVFFGNFPGFFGTMKKFQPHPAWLEKHHEQLKES